MLNTTCIMLKYIILYFVQLDQMFYTIPCNAFEISELYYKRSHLNLLFIYLVSCIQCCAMVVKVVVVTKTSDQEIFKTHNSSFCLNFEVNISLTD